MELIQRAAKGDLDGVKTLIQQGVCVNAKNYCNQTALYLACEKGHADVVQYLLNSGASISLGENPLIAAVWNCNYKCVKLLLEHHASVNGMTTEGESPMSIAVQMYDYSIILLLLEYGAIPSTSLSDVALKQLLKYAEAEHAKAVQTLIDQNRINLTSESVFLATFSFAFKRGSAELAERLLFNDNYSKIEQLYTTAVYYSAKNNWPTILSKLLQKRMNINELTNGQTALHAACELGHETIVTLLLDNDADPNVKNACIGLATAPDDFQFPLQVAIPQGNVAICNMLLQKGAKLDQLGQPLLHIAYHAANETNEAPEKEQMLLTMRLLLQHGVNVDAVFDEGDTILYRACENEQLEIVRILLEAGADVKCTNSNNRTCLHALINAYSSAKDSKKPAAGVSTVDIVSVIKSLLEAGADVNTWSLQQEAALYQAIIAGHEDIVKLLLDAGAETNGSSSCHPLHVACERGNTEIVALLLQHGVNVNAVSDDGDAALYCACKNQQLEIVKILLEAGADVNHTSNRHYPLIAACDTGNLELVSLLITAGVDVKCTNSNNRTCLHALINSYSCKKDSQKPAAGVSTDDTVSAIKSLLEAGADVNTWSLQEETALYQAIIAGHEDIVKLLLDAGAETNGSSSCHPLHVACERGNTEIVTLLLQHGVNVNAVSDKGDTALHSACESGQFKMVQILLEAGAYVNHMSYGETALSIICKKRQACANVVELLFKCGADLDIHSPLYSACKNNNTDIVKLLLAHGAHVNLHTKATRLIKKLSGMLDDQPSPLCTACRNGNVAIVDCLLKSGADVAFVDNDGDSTLHCAIERLGERQGQQVNSEEYDPIVTLLLQHDAPVNVFSSIGETPLYVACTKGLAGVVKQLLDCKADVNLTKSGANKYPLLISCERKFTDIAVMLLDQGAETNVNKYGDTPLKLALASGDAELIKQLLGYGADVNHMQIYCNDALHDAVFQWHQCTDVGKKASLNKIQMLLENGARPNALNHKCEAPLNLACKYLTCRQTKYVCNVNLDIVQVLLEHGADPNARPLSSMPLGLHGDDHDVGLPPLLVASRCCNTELIVLLINYGATVDYRTKLGKTALHYAIGSICYSFGHCLESSKNSKSTVEVLLSAGADPNAVDNTGASPLYLACESGKTDLVELLLSRGVSPNVIAADRTKLPMHAACKGRHYDLVKLLLECNADVTLRDDHGKTALHIAAADGCYELVELLLKHGSDVDISDDSGNTALHYGVKNYYSVKSVVDVLLKNKANVNTSNDSGKTPLYTAVSKGLVPVVSKMLHANSGNPNTFSPDKSALAAACEMGNVEIVDMLLKNGAEPNPTSDSCDPNYKCRLPLCSAFKNYDYYEQRYDIITLLIKAGASVNGAVCEGKTALYTATKRMTSALTARPLSRFFRQKRNLLSTIRLMLEHGADVNVLMQDGQSLLHLVISSIATRRYKTHLIELLQLYVKEGGAILSDSQNISRQSPNVLKNLARFEEKHEFIVDLFRAGAGFQLIALCCKALARRRRKVSSIRLCQAVVLAGYRPSDEVLQHLRSAAENEDVDDGLLGHLMIWLNENRQRVPSLFCQCRIVVRRQLSLAVRHRSILPAIDKLPLPNGINRYLQFEGVFTEVDLSIKKELCADETLTENGLQLISPDSSDFEDDSEDYLYDYDDGSDNSSDSNGSDSDEWS